MRNTVTVILVHDETESVLDTLFDGAESPNRVLNVSSVIHHFSTLAEGINDASNTMVIDLKFGGTALHVGSSLHGGADELPRPPPTKFGVTILCPVRLVIAVALFLSLYIYDYHPNS